MRASMVPKQGNPSRIQAQGAANSSIKIVPKRHLRNRKKQSNTMDGLKECTRYHGSETQDRSAWTQLATGAVAGHSWQAQGTAGKHRLAKDAVLPLELAGKQSMLHASLAPPPQARQRGRRILPFLLPRTPWKETVDVPLQC